MDFNAYLDRIKFKDPIKIDIATLKSLQHHHIHAVPFENLNIHYQREIVLNTDLLFDKIVNQKRGGFCYELNGKMGLAEIIGIGTGSSSHHRGCCRISD